MNNFRGYYIFIIFLIIGMFMGMIQHDIIIPALGSKAHPYYQGIKGKNMISITFNVDWGEEYIPALLNILADENIKATFFITGNWAGKFPGLLKDIAEQGHEIGNHGYTHAHPVKLSENQFINHIKKNESLLYNLTGSKTSLYAPPYGEVNKRITKIAADLGYNTIMWSVDSLDWKRPAAEIIVQRVINKVEDGGIILLHPTRTTVEALPEIIKKLRERKFKFVPISKLIQ